MCLSVCLFVCLLVSIYSRTTGYEAAYERYQQLQCNKGRKNNVVLAAWDILLYACHIPGIRNSVADAISRDKMSFFLFQGAGCLSSSNDSTTGPSGLTGHGAARLDPSQLGALVQELFAAGLAPSTQKSYKSGERRYLQFCATVDQSPYPVSERGLSAFVAFLYQQGLSAATMKSYLAAVRYAQIAIGLPLVP